MNDPYVTLGISSDASEEEIKKAYKKLAVKYHPDVYKEPDGDAKFKEITAAYQILTSSPKESEDAFVNLSDIFQHFTGFSMGSNVKKRKLKEITHTIILSFQESVLGCTKNFEKEVEIYCETCHSLGKISDLSKKCSECKGLGTVTTQKQSNSRSSFIIQVSCPKCNGIKFEQSFDPKCSGTGVIKKKFNFNNVKIPPATQNNTTFNFNRLPQLTIIVQVTSDPKLSLQDNNVVENLSISLLEALSGCTKSITLIDNTIYELKIPSLSKHKDQLYILGKGAPTPRPGDHIITLNLEYPPNTKELINFLSTNN